MSYLLVLQFPEDKYGDLDWIAKMEEKIDPHLGDNFVDGHDIGSGTVNIFILTSNPQESFAIAKNVIEKEGGVIQDMKAAYREIESGDFVFLWPSDLKKFDIM